MEKIISVNNAQAGWDILNTFGLRHRQSFIGWNRYQGKNSAVLKIDPVSGMRILFYPAKAPRSERSERTITLKTPGKRGRPMLFNHPKQESEFIGPRLKRGRPALIGPRIAKETLVFFGPLRKRGPKVGSIRVQGNGQTFGSTETLIAGTKPAKKGRLSEKERIAMAPVGSVIKANGGGWWKIIAKGLPSYQDHA